MAARVDMDAYMRGCTMLENFEVRQMGGVRRRRGMRRLNSALSNESVIFSYIYSYSIDDGVFLIELSPSKLRVLSANGNEIQTFTNSDNYSLPYDMSKIRVKQINSNFIICSQDVPTLVLIRDENGEWSLSEWRASKRMWRYVYEKRDYPISITKIDDTYTVDFSQVEDVLESSGNDRDVLRASFYTERNEVFATRSSMTNGVAISDGAEPAYVGKKIAVHYEDEDVTTYWVCISEWEKETQLVDGLDDPSNYKDNFERAENLSSFGGLTPISSLKEAADVVAKGDKIAIKAGYWKYFTCIKEFTADDLIAGKTKYEDYSGFFVSGIAVGDAAPCKGTWNFVCYGIWYGEYEVRRNYKSPEISDEWETVGVSTSRIGEPSNTQITGDETDEECYLRLFITKSKRINENAISDGFPADSCQNMLVVSSYKHDLELSLSYVSDSFVWSDASKISVDWNGTKEFYDWSWCAWSARYGYPSLCEVYNQRLVFASTQGQPQTIWMSRTDDLTNFSVGDSDDSALALTMSTTTQNAIGWILAQSHRLLLGTSEAEWIISAGASQASITPSNAQIEDHGHVGSEGIAGSVIDKVLYIERGAGRCYEFGYAIETDSYRSRDLTVYAPHILADHGGAVSYALIRKPDTVAVFPTGDGQLALCTYNTMHNVNAWHRYITNGKIKSAAVLPNGNANDRLFLVVQRNGGTFIEVIDEDSDYTDEGEDYTSTLVTNALGNPLEKVMSKNLRDLPMLLFGADCKQEYIELSSDGETWTKTTKFSPVITKGWHQMMTNNSWKYESVFGIRFTGNDGISILALQA